MRKSTNVKYVDRIQKEILKRLGSGRSVSLTMKSTGDDLIIAKGSDGFTLYNGCDLIVGDTSIKVISMMIADGDVRP